MNDEEEEKPMLVTDYLTPDDDHPYQKPPVASQLHLLYKIQPSTDDLD